MDHLFFFVLGVGKEGVCLCPGPPLTNFNDWGGGGGSNRGSYFIPKKSTSEFAYPKKLLCFLAYPKNPLSLVHTSEISTSTNTRHICMCIKLMAWFVDD